jgi:anti-sigma B factor antagonist
MRVYPSLSAHDRDDARFWAAVPVEEPTMDSKLTITEHEAGDVTALTMSGQMLLDDGDLAFRKVIHELVDRGRVKVVLNMSGVSYIDSAGIGMIAGKLKTLRERGGDMKLANLSTRGQRVFGMAKLLLMFETFETEAEAVKSFAFKVR